MPETDKTALGAQNAESSAPPPFLRAQPARTSTIRQCDRVVVLEAGRIVADGTFDEIYDEYLK